MTHAEHDSQVHNGFKERTIFHIDVNSAFLSWSAAQALLDDPDCIDLRTVASAVGGDEKSRHGIILAKSIPAKKFGIKTAEPVAAALRKCPSLILVKPEFSVYNKFSRAFIAILNKRCPVVEQVSVDEAFVDMTGMGNIYNTPTEAAHLIKDEIKDTLGFTVNVGISSNKLLAKMASDVFEKPDKVNTLYPCEVQKKMWPLPVGELYGIGRATAAALEQIGLKTIGDAASCDIDFLKRKFGEKQGSLIWLSSNGTDNSEIKASSEAPKSYGNSITLSEDMTSLNKDKILTPTLLALCESVASRMRRDGVKAKTVSVQLKNSEFISRSKQLTLNKPVDGTDELYKTALKLLTELWNGYTPIRLIGVSAGKITRGDSFQINMFETPELSNTNEIKVKADRAADEIRAKFGKGSIMRGALLENEYIKGVGKKED